ncbi:UNVERIFIED_CONTAM: Pentatricopeptide repeat-containing protein, mitochondrial [Sesamum calycinum]|uniref:Pentatricopeptide repeat-containing protein, mitochondrial n=1 Tax=Sesamum calycinum TaxID=2727403 RepID=A0AAW2N113_9LAMI
MVSLPRRNPSEMIPLSTLLKSGFTPTLKDSNNFLLFLYRNRKFKAIIHVFSQVNSNKINADAQTHTIFAKALLKENRYEEAAEFLKTLVAKSKILDKNRVLDSLVQGVCTFNQDPEKGFSLLKDFLKIDGVCPSSRTFCLLVFSFSKMGKMDRVIDLLELMSDDKFKYPFDNYVCSSVISGFVRIGEPELAVGFYETAVKSGSLTPNTVTCTSVLTAYCKLRNMDKVSDLVSWMENNELAFDVVFYSNWVYGCLREGLIYDAFRKYREMVDKKVELDIISYTILIDGFSKDGNVERAVGFLYKMRKDGLEPNLISYTAIILGFCKKGKLDEAFAIFNMLERLGIQADEFTYAILIDGVCRKGDFDLVFHLLDEMDKKGINPGIVTYNTVINGLCKVGRMAEADDFSKGIVGDVVTYTTLLQAYVQEESNSGILETKRRVEAAGIHMDLVMCNILIKALLMVGLFEDAFAIYKGLPQMDLSANSVTYYILIDGYCKAGRIDEALEIFDEFRKVSNSSAACYNCIISGLCRKDMIDMAIDVLIEYIQKGLPLDRKMYMTLIEATFDRKGAEGVLEMIYRIDHIGLLELHVVWNNAISFLCKMGFPEASYNILLVMRRKGLVQMSFGYYSILRVLLFGGKKLLAQLILTSFVKTYGMSDLSVCRHINKALDLCTLAKKKGIALNIVAYNSVINGLCSQGCLVEAFRLFDSLERVDVLPTEVTYGTLIDALVKEGLLQDARLLFGRMFLKDLRPATRIYNSLINGYCKSSLLEEAIKLFQDLELRDLKPDGFTVGALINGFCQKGGNSSHQVMPSIYNGTDFHPLSSDANNIENMLKICATEDGEKQQLKDFDSFYSLIHSLCLKGELAKANRFTKLLMEL